MTTTTVTGQIFEQITTLLDDVSRYAQASLMVFSVHVLPVVNDEDSSRNLLADIEGFEKGPLAELVKMYRSIDSVNISGLGALIGRPSGSVNVRIAYKRQTI